MAAQEALFTCLENLISLSEGSSGPLRRSALFSEGSRRSTEGAKVISWSVFGGSRELPKSSEALFETRVVELDPLESGLGALGG